MTPFTDEDQTIDYARGQWLQGEQRMNRFSGDSRRRMLLEQVVEGIVAELERRVGQTFETITLVEAYAGAESWSMDIAHRQAPQQPWAWDLDIVQNAAFHRFARRASDYRP